MPVETVSGYQFRPTDMHVADRTDGISAFMRCRNGANFVESTIRSHIGFYDEIVVVYNQCEDDTPAILARLQQEYGPKLRLYHYTDRVHPLGSGDHAAANADSPNSMVNYSNFVLAKTRHRIVVKLDDDHFAIPGAVAKMVSNLRAGRLDKTVQHCFSGLNLARNASGALCIPAFDPVVGGGDHSYFYATEDTRFYYDRRFERFGRGSQKRRFAGFFYWHLKYLKAGQGFRNYELTANPDSRYARKKNQFESSGLLGLPDLRAQFAFNAGGWLAARLGEKARLKYDRNRHIRTIFHHDNLEAALDALSPDWRQVPGLGQGF